MRHFHNNGHKDYVGLTGLEFIDNKGKIINIEKAKTIGALPKDLHTPQSPILNIFI